MRSLRDRSLKEKGGGRNEIDYSIATILLALEFMNVLTSSSFGKALIFLTEGSLV